MIKNYKKNTEKKLIVILLGLLFISVSYNIWWVGYERSGNEQTIQDLNKYINLSKNVFISYEDLYKSSGEYSIMATENFASCKETSFLEAEKAIKLMESKLDEINEKKSKVEELARIKNEFIKTTHLVKIKPSGNF